MVFTPAIEHCPKQDTRTRGDARSAHAPVIDLRLLEDDEMRRTTLVQDAPLVQPRTAKWRARSIGCSGLAVPIPQPARISVRPMRHDTHDDTGGRRGGGLDDG
jgi:hypothetical protein